MAAATAKPDSSAAEAETAAWTEAVHVPTSTYSAPQSPQPPPARFKKPRLSVEDRAAESNSKVSAEWVSGARLTHSTISEPRFGDDFDAEMMMLAGVGDEGGALNDDDGNGEGDSNDEDDDDDEMASHMTSPEIFGQFNCNDSNTMYGVRF
jgi:hypothetical protein